MALRGDDTETVGLLRRVNADRVPGVKLCEDSLKFGKVPLDLDDEIAFFRSVEPQGRRRFGGRRVFLKVFLQYAMALFTSSGRVKTEGMEVKARIWEKNRALFFVTRHSMAKLLTHEILTWRLYA